MVLFFGAGTGMGRMVAANTTQSMPERELNSLTTKDNPGLQFKMKLRSPKIGLEGAQSI